MLKNYLFAVLAGLLLAAPLAQAQRVGGTIINSAPGGGQPLTAMAPEETPWSHLVDSLTASLNKSSITTGILYDRALPLAALHSFGVHRTTGRARNCPPPTCPPASTTC